MAYQITNRAAIEASRENIQPNLAFVIDGVPNIFGVTDAKVVARYGENGIVYGQKDLVYGGLVKLEASEDLIALNGTTNQISQQLEPDKGAASSTSSLVVRLIDEDQKISKIISPSFVVDDVLYRDCQILLGAANSSFPDDYIVLFNGKVQGIKSRAGSIDFFVAHPEDAKRSEVFAKVETTLVEPLDYFASTLNSVRFQQRPDVSGIVEVEFFDGPFDVTVSGNLISIGILPNITTAKSIKRLIENDQSANQLVTVSLTGTGDETAQPIPVAPLEVDLVAKLESTQGLLLPTANGLFKTYLRINDEIMQYDSIDYVNNTVNIIDRASLTSFGGSHEAGDDVYSFYKLGDGTAELGNALNLALQIMISGGDQYYDQKPVSSFVQAGPVNVTNAVFFSQINIANAVGVTIGDFVTVENALNVGNNFIDGEIIDIVSNFAGSYLVIKDKVFTPEVSSTATISFKSRYAVLPDGLGIKPKQIDILEFERINAVYGSGIANYEFYLKESIDTKEFINQQIYLPTACYTLPRKGRISVGYTAPPLFNEGSKVLDFDSVVGPSSLSIDRSINSQFYNAIVWKYDEDPVEDKLTKGNIFLSSNSTSRIKAPTKPYTIEANGLRASESTQVLIERLSNRFFNRYEYGAETIQVQVPFKVGWTMEVGDTCIFGDSQMQLPDTTKGNREFSPRIFEVQNKSFNWKTGEIRLTLVDTNFTQGVRYGVLSPSSIVGTGSSFSRIKLTKSFGTSATGKERDKWALHIGKTIRVTSPDFLESYHVKLEAFDSDDITMIVSPPLPEIPQAGWRVDSGDYDSLANTDASLKAIYVHYCPEVEIIMGLDDKSFTVEILDADQFFVGSFVRVSSVDYSVDSGDKFIRVASVVGSTITLQSSLGFTPQAGYIVTGIGFKSDQGAPYAYI